MGGRVAIYRIATGEYQPRTALRNLNVNRRTPIPVRRRNRPTLYALLLLFLPLYTALDPFCRPYLPKYVCIYFIYVYTEKTVL